MRLKSNSKSMSKQKKKKINMLVKILNKQRKIVFHKMFFFNKNINGAVDMI